MEEKAGYEAARESANVFTPAFDSYNDPGRIVTLGPYYGATKLMESQAALTYIRRHGPGGRARDGAASVEAMREAAEWTRFLEAFNKGRKWARTRLFDRLDPMLEAGIALATVPSHDPYQDAPSIRLLARKLAERGRVDATSCLVRHTKIRRIVFGGPSYPELHRQTINVVHASLIEGRNVLLLDDIARSGASLNACKELLCHAGARRVQAMALGKIVTFSCP